MPFEVNAIEVHNLSKRYEVFQNPSARMMAALFGRKGSRRYFEALKQTTLEVKRGGFLGVIGQNGSGKSTLLQLICGIVTPTTGTVNVSGRVAALLELGAGFNPEYSGYENSKLNAQILGLTNQQFDQRFPEIEAFADIGEFMHQPVKLYSSGMYVRLAFAIQACIDPDILIVDEALAVGDIFFRLKCYERLDRLRKKGCTVILVTHSMDDVMHYCDSVLLLDHGDVVFYGDPSEAISRYYALGNTSASQMPSGSDSRPVSLGSGSEADWSESDGCVPFIWPQSEMLDVRNHEQVGDGAVLCTQVAVTDSRDLSNRTIKQFEHLKIYAEFKILRDLETPVVGFVIRTDRGVIVHGRHTAQCGSTVPAYLDAGQIVRVVFDVPLGFGVGEYIIEVGFATWSREIFGATHQMSMAELESSSRRHCVLPNALNFSIIPPQYYGFGAQSFYGLGFVDSRATLYTHK
jgi:lipopolysaccharide transport system ATP-binding protein